MSRCTSYQTCPSGFTLCPSFLFFHVFNMVAKQKKVLGHWTTYCKHFNFKNQKVVTRVSMVPKLVISIN